MAVSVFYVSPPCGCCRRQRLVWVTGRVSVLSAGVSVRVHLWDACSASLEVAPASGKVAAASLSLGKDSRSPGTGLGSSSQAGLYWWCWSGLQRHGRRGPWLQCLEAVASLDIP